jgi:peptidase E
MRYSIHEDWCYNAFQHYIKPGMKVVVIPFSFYQNEIYDDITWTKYYGKENGIYCAGIIESFRRYGIDASYISMINYFQTSKEEAKLMIKNADIIYLPGGLPDKMYEKIVEFSLLEVIMSHKGVVIGHSAGAMIQLDEYFISPDWDFSEFGYYPGLGLIKGFGIEVHFRDLKTQFDAIKKYMIEKHKNVYAITDQGALIVDNGKISVIGDVKYYAT